MKKILVCILCLYTFSLSIADDGWKDFYKEARRGLRSKISADRVNTIKSFAEQDHKDSATVLVGLISKRSTSPEERLAAGETLGKFKSEDALKYVYTIVSKNVNAAPAIVRAFAEMNHEKANLVFANILFRAKGSAQLTAAINAIGKKSEQSEKVCLQIIARLKGKSFQSVKKACVRALGGIAYTKSVPVLAELFEDRLLSELAHDSLKRLTGKDIGLSKSDWLKWYEGNNGFTPANKQLEEFQKNKEVATKAEKKRAKEAGETQFFGVTIEGKNVLFVLDKSGSMVAPAYGSTRIQVLKNKFKEMLDGLSEEISTAVVFFPGSKVYPASGVKKADAAYKTKLKKYIDKIGPGGSTPISHAMQYAFEKVVSKRDIDTIYLLSDGQPNNPPEQVRKLIQALNADSYLEIHTISFGMTSKFLKDVAADNNGTYTEIQ